MQIANSFLDFLASIRRQALESVYLAPQVCFARILVGGHIEPFSLESVHDGAIRTTNEIEFVGSKLIQRTLGEVSRKHRTQERVAVLERIRQWGDGSLDLLGLVSGVLGVPAPGNFDKGSGTAECLFGPPFFEHVIEIMGISARIGPRDFLLSSARGPTMLVVQVQPEFFGDGGQGLANGGLQLLSDDLP